MPPLRNATGLKQATPRRRKSTQIRLSLDDRQQSIVNEAAGRAGTTASDLLKSVLEASVERMEALNLKARASRDDAAINHAGANITGDAAAFDAEILEMLETDPFWQDWQ